MSPILLEGTTAIYTASIVDENSVAVPVAQLLTLTLTYYDVDTLQIQNSRNAQNILNQNNVTVDSAGLLTWTLQPADTAIVTSTKRHEVHRALFTWTWGSPTKVGRHEVEFVIQNVTLV